MFNVDNSPYYPRPLLVKRSDAGHTRRSRAYCCRRYQNVTGFSGACSVADQLITGDSARSTGSCSMARKPATRSKFISIISRAGFFEKANLTGTLASPEGKLPVATPLSAPGSPAKAPARLDAPFHGYRPILAIEFKDMAPATVWRIAQIRKKVSDPPGDRFCSVRLFRLIDRLPEPEVGAALHGPDKLIEDRAQTSGPPFEVKRCKYLDPRPDATPVVE